MGDVAIHEYIDHFVIYVAVTTALLPICSIIFAVRPWHANIACATKKGYSTRSSIDVQPGTSYSYIRHPSTACPIIA